MQQASETTFRLYDYGRPRELHLERGMAVAQTAPYAAENRRSIADGPTLVNGAHFRLDRIEGDPDDDVWAAYPRGLLALPLAGTVAAKDGSARAQAGECLFSQGINALDFREAEITLLATSSD